MKANVSLITSVKNGEKYLDECVRSILEQSYPYFKYYIYVDMSFDNSLSIARKWEQMDDRITVINGTKVSAGIGEVFSYVIDRYVDTKYVAIVDADDFIHQECLKETVKVLDNDENAGLVYTLAFLIDGEDKMLGIDKRAQQEFVQENFLLSFIPFHFRLIRMRDYEKTEGYSAEMELCEDFDLCLQLSEVTKIVKCNIPLYFYRRHEQNQSRERHIDMVHYVLKAIQRALDRRGLAEKLDVKAKFHYEIFLEEK